MERSAIPSCHDFVIKFLLNCWLGLLTPFCRSGFLKNLHRVGNVPVLVVSGRACKKRRLLREQVSCKVHQNMRWKRSKIQMVKVLIFFFFFNAYFDKLSHSLEYLRCTVSSKLLEEGWFLSDIVNIMCLGSLRNWIASQIYELLHRK